MIGLGGMNGGWTPASFHVASTPQHVRVKGAPVSLMKAHLHTQCRVIYSPGFRIPPVPKFRVTTTEGTDK